MATQSRAPVILLTRPAAGSARFAATLRARFPDLPIITSPLLAPRFLSPNLPARDWAALIFTSETAVQAAQRIAAEGTILPHRAFCVGDQTARAARAAGFDATSAAGDAQALLPLIQSRPMPGPLLHLHGADTRGDIANRLCAAGIDTVSAVAYAQDLQQLSETAAALLTSGSPVLAPVFSPRTAQALAQECHRIGAVLPVIVAISPAAAAPFAPHLAHIAAHPDATALLDAVALLLNAPPQP